MSNKRNHEQSHEGILTNPDAEIGRRVNISAFEMDKNITIKADKDLARIESKRRNYAAF